MLNTLVPTVSPERAAQRDDHARLLDEAKARAARLRREAIRDGGWRAWSASGDMRHGDALLGACVAGAGVPRPSRAHARLQARRVQHARQRAAATGACA